MTTRVSNSLFLGVLPPKGSVNVGWYARVLSERDWASQVALVERFAGMGFTRAVNDIGGGKIVLDSDDRLFTDTLPLGETVRVQDQEALWQIIENGVIRAEFLAEDLQEDVIHPETGVRTTEISGRGTGAVLDWAKVMPEGMPTPSKMSLERHAHPMQVFTSLLTAAQDEGYLPFVSRSFDVVTDSAGNPWGGAVDLTVNAGESLLDLLNRWCEAYDCSWRMLPGFILEVLQGNSSSRHLEDTVVFTAHRDQNEHSRMVSRREIANVVFTETSVPAPVEGEPDGLVVAVASDGDSQARWRKRALWLSSGDAGGATAASAVANATLGLTKDPKQSRTIKIDPTIPGRLPFEDFDANDWVAVELEKGATDSEARRVMAISVDIDEDGYPAVELTLQSRFENRQIKLQKAIDKMGGGTGSSASSTPIPASGSIARTRLADLADVDPTGAVSGRVLTYRDGKWVDEEPVVQPVPSLDMLTDVSAAAPADKQALVWDAAGSVWKPGSVAAGGAAGAAPAAFVIGDVVGSDSGSTYAGATTNLTVRRTMTLTGIDYAVITPTTYTLKIDGVVVASVVAAAAGPVAFTFPEFVMNPGAHTIGVYGAVAAKVRYKSVASVVHTGFGYDFTAAGWAELAGSYTIPFVYRGSGIATLAQKHHMAPAALYGISASGASVGKGNRVFCVVSGTVVESAFWLVGVAGKTYRFGCFEVTSSGGLLGAQVGAFVDVASPGAGRARIAATVNWALVAGKAYVLTVHTTDSSALTAHASPSTLAGPLLATFGSNAAMAFTAAPAAGVTIAPTATLYEADTSMQS